MTLIACLHPRQCRTLIADTLMISPNAPVDEIALPMRTYIPPDQVGDMRLCRKVIQINSNLVALWAGDYNQAYLFAERAMKWFSGDANSKDHLLGFQTRSDLRPTPWLTRQSAANPSAGQVPC